MSTSKWIGLSIAAACAVVALLAWQRTPSTDEGTGAGQTSSAPRPQQGSNWFQAQTGSASGSPGALEPANKPGITGKGPSALASVAPPRFKTDAQGQLEMSAQTRDGIEQVAALYGDDRDQARAKLAEATQDLPASAQRAVQDLYQRYQQYMQAVRQAFPPEQQEHMTLPQAEEAFEKLQKVRETYMGDAGKALWARDDAVTRKLLDYAGDYIRQHPEATLAQASEAAQDLYSREVDGMQQRHPAPPSPSVRR